MNQKQRAILNTILWFSLFDRPVTVFEIQRYSKEPLSLGEVRKILDEDEELKCFLHSHQGFFAPRNRNIAEMMKQRHNGFIDASRKMKKLKRLMWFFSLFPFVRAVFAANTLSLMQTKPTSDIDILLIVRPGTIWISRLLLVSPFALLKQRPNQFKPAKDPVDFSFFITTKSLHLASLKKGEEGYLPMWMRELIPLLDRDGLREELILKNEWVGEIYPQNVQKPLHDYLFQSRKALPLSWLSLFEGFAKRFQLKRLPRELTQKVNQGTDVIVSDDMLKFHANDRRDFYDKAFKDAQKEIGLSE